ncbi:transposase [Variovorax sp. J31P207]|uniref:IS66-like element accessory protein TnpA n=1 Tax=Variovorax sp. J31P207 TaxID=3053510 RepID=UPI00257702FD|nr:transposase [Variovorax sp. J31P207]MDM0071856.1 transposase [Variovorax sp. J31P207]
MTEWISELARRLVIGHKRDGRSIYDPQAKLELVLACRESGVSIAKLARECGVNANQVNSWVRLHERKMAKAASPNMSALEVQAPAFVPVHIDAASATPAQAPVSMDVQARLPNGVVVDLRGCDMQQAYGMIEALGRLRCSASTKG